MKKLNKIFITLTIIIINMFFCFNAYGAAKQNYVATLTGDSTVKKES